MRFLFLSHTTSSETLPLPFERIGHSSEASTNYNFQVYSISNFYILCFWQGIHVFVEEKSGSDTTVRRG